jgi:2-oxoglutarate ferredoxin oxidoreductase subunit alpha
VFIVEANRDGQLRTMIQTELGVPVEKLKSLRYYAGFPMSSHHIVSGVTAQLKPAAVVSALEAQS